jgi:uncharacterized protein YkwD
MSGGASLLGLLAIVAAVMAPAPCAAAPTAPSDLGAAVLAELNAARADPPAYARRLRGLGRSAAEAAAFLQQQTPMPPLEADDRLIATAEAHAADQAGQAMPGHTGSDGSSPMRRMQRAGVAASLFAEEIALGQDGAAGVVAQLIIDAPGPRRPHRDDLFDPKLRVAGVGCGPSRAWRRMCVIDLAGAAIPRESADAGAAPAAVIRPLPMTPERGRGAAPPPPGETRFAPAEVLIEVAASAAPDAIAALERRQHLKVVERLTSALTGSTILLARIDDRRAPGAVIAALGGQPEVISVQPDYVYALQAGEAGAAQYAAQKLRLAQAHRLAKGTHVLVGVIDGGVAATNPELQGALAATFDATNAPVDARTQGHGTAVAGLIAAHAQLTGSAPAARLLAARAFGAGASASGTSFAILKSLDWVAVHGARVVNMSFAGPRDPALHRAIEGASLNGLVMVAAAGNAGPASPPLYPAAEPQVIAVAATDDADAVYPASNRGPHVVLAAPGVDVLVATPSGAYELMSGTSFSAAEVSGVAALMLERRPSARPNEIRAALLASSRALTGGLRLVDAYAATLAETPR